MLISLLSVRTVLLSDRLLGATPLSLQQNRQRLGSLCRLKVGEFAPALAHRVETVSRIRGDLSNEADHSIAAAQVRTTDRAIDAFRRMVALKASGLAVVDEDGVLVDTISARDLRVSATALIAWGRPGNVQLCRALESAAPSTSVCSTKSGFSKSFRVSLVWSCCARFTHFFLAGDEYRQQVRFAGIQMLDVARRRMLRCADTEPHVVGDRGR